MICWPFDRRQLGAVAAALVLLLAQEVGSARAATDSVGKREIRDARTAVREGRLDQALELYERILEASPNEEQRFESLYNATLILLSSEAGPEAAERARRRLEALEDIARSVEPERRLEIEAIAALVTDHDALQAGNEELQDKLIAASLAADLAMQEAQARCDEALEAQAGLLVLQEEESALLEQRLDQAQRHLATREDELQDRVEELGRCRAETQFLLDQLEGTHASESQMLEVVMRKNEELAVARRALRRREGELAEQAKQLEAKQEEIRKREDAIREVTERILGKESPDS